MLYRMFHKFGLIRNTILLCYGYSNVLWVIEMYTVQEKAEIVLLHAFCLSH